MNEQPAGALPNTKANGAGPIEPDRGTATRADDYLDKIVFSRKTFFFSSRIISHEISNELMNLSHCAYLLKHQKPESFSRGLDEIRQCMESIPRLLKMLAEHEPAPSALLAILKVVFPGKYATVDVPGGIHVKVPMPQLVSFVSNIYENALQAYERNFGNLEGFKVEVRFEGASLIIDDNAGGFDVSAIAPGRSSKGPGNGDFLAAFLNDTRHLGFLPSIERIDGGTRVKILFDQIETRDV